MISPAQMKIAEMSVHVGVNISDMSIADLIQYVEENSDALTEAISFVIDDAVATGFRSPEETLAFVDTSKSLISRNAIIKRRAHGRGRIAALSGTKPHLPRAYLDSNPETAVCNFIVKPSGETWIIFAQSFDGNRPHGFSLMNVIPKEQAPEFNSDLTTLATREIGAPPNFDALDRILGMLGSRIILFFLQYGRPKKVVFVPHKRLHLLPLHAIFADADDKRIYIDDLIPEMTYASNFQELLYANVRIGEQPSDAELKMLAMMDIGAPGLDWIELERRQFEVLRRMGLPFEVRTSKDGLPETMDCYGLINLSCHAKSAASSWGGSRLIIGEQIISAYEIAESWSFDRRPVVTLAACETGYGSSPNAEIDEYCGLDVAFKIAGASTIYASMWCIPDDFAALASTTFAQWAIQARVPLAHLAVIFQNNLRRGVWPSWLLRPEQLSQARSAHPDIYPEIAAVQDRFRALNADQFRHPFYWASFRCYCG